MAGGIALARWRQCPNVCERSSLPSPSPRVSWMSSMLEVAAALCAGLGVMVAILAVGAAPPAAIEDALAAPWLRRHAGSPGLVAIQAVVGALGGLAAALLTGLPVLTVAGAVGAVALVRGAISSHRRSRQVVRQDAVLEAVRMLRQLLETGAASVHAAIAILGERGPAPLRSEFRIIAATSVGRRQAGSSAR